MARAWAAVTRPQGNASSAPRCRPIAGGSRGRPGSRAAAQLYKKILEQFQKRLVAKTLPHMPQPRFAPVLAVAVLIEKGKCCTGKGRGILKGQLLPQHDACGRPWARATLRR